MTNKNKIIIGTPIKNKTFPVGFGFFDKKTNDLPPTPTPPGKPITVAEFSPDVVVLADDNVILRFS